MLLRSIFLVATLAFGASACAGNLCERRASYLSDRCAGTGVVYTPDALCERNLDVCPDSKLKAFGQYVGCLERHKVCSMEVISACAAKHPTGVNLMCAG